MSHEDAPCLFFSSEKRIKAGRKAHSCFMCRELIEVGQPKMELTAMTDDNDKPWTVYEHLGCYGADRVI
jgi:hypothetical protein